MLLHAQPGPFAARRSSRLPLSSGIARAAASASARTSGAEQEESYGANASAQSSSRRNLLLAATGTAAAAATLFSSPLPAVAAAESPSSTISSSITPPATIFVAGATGATGKRTVAALVASGYQVRAGVRDRVRAEALLLPFSSPASKIEIVDLDLETMSVEQLAAAIGDEAAAVVCCVGSRPSSPLDTKVATLVDEVGTINLIKAAKSKANVSKFVLLSSILTNGKAVGQGFNPAFIFLELFSGGVLSKKLAAEKALRAAGLPSWSVVRPGGLASKSPEELGAGGVFLSAEDTIFGESEQHGIAVSRDDVADVLVAAVRAPSNNKVVEVVTSKSVPTRLSQEELDRAWAAV